MTKYRIVREIEKDGSYKFYIEQRGKFWGWNRLGRRVGYDSFWLPWEFTDIEEAKLKAQAMINDDENLRQYKANGGRNPTVVWP